MTTLYLVALLPPEPVFSEIWAMKQEVHSLTGSRNAINLPPHITLVPPLRQNAEFEEKCIAALASFAKNQRVLSVGLNGFDWFGNRTLFVRVSEAAALRKLHEALTDWCAIYLPEVPVEHRPFTPHLTLATRDLPPAQVPELCQLFATRAYVATFKVPNLTLFRHNGRQWQPRATFELANEGGPAVLSSESA